MRFKGSIRNLRLNGHFYFTFIVVLIIFSLLTGCSSREPETSTPTKITTTKITTQVTSKNQPSTPSSSECQSASDCGFGLKCCSGECYSSITEICCGGKVYPHSGGTNSNGVPRWNHCCGGVVYTWGICCNGVNYDSSEYSCCNNVPYKGKDRCCEGTVCNEGYTCVSCWGDSAKKICCPKGYRCCNTAGGPTCYDPDKSYCM